ncbi:hypothetical protein [uncultured Bacteroides sp.]|uniref:hypothetical protein n=1 Tax=uncultured Bacteroides sp. TaxID=162156 RepID=UPI002AAADFF1|nr:hypothetical protein [uncultured Bacteroides sp.]
MKKILYLILFIPSICLAQTKNDLLYLIDKFPVDKGGNVDFCIMDSINDVSQETIHTKAIQAIGHFFKDTPSPAVPLFVEKDNAIVYRGRFGRYERAKKTFSTVLHTYIYRFTLKIKYNDNKYKIDIYDISESENNITTDLSDLLNKDYYIKANLSSNSIKTKYNSIYFIYNYLTNKIYSINQYMKATEKKSGKEIKQPR